jgi:hypothetical protein
VKQFKQLKQILTIGLLSFSMFSVSCAKKGSAIRAIKQTDSKIMNPSVSTPSIRAADAQSLKYDMVSISWPTENNSELKIEAEIKTPDGRYIPFTTFHKNNYDSVGVIDDMEKNGTKIDIRARCEGENCEKYLLLATVVKGGFAVHQMAVVSYSSDCKFNLENINYTVARLYSGLDDLSQRNKATAQNDRPTDGETNCPAQ